MEDNYILNLAQRAKRAAEILANSSGNQRTEALQAMARDLRSQTEQIIEANGQDLEAGRKAGLSEAMLDRLLLNKERIGKMADRIEHELEDWAAGVPFADDRTVVLLRRR